MTGTHEKWMNGRGSWNGAEGAASLPPLLREKPGEKAASKEPFLLAEGPTLKPPDATFTLPVCGKERGDIEVKRWYEVYMNPKVAGSRLQTPQKKSTSFAEPAHNPLPAVETDRPR